MRGEYIAEYVKTSRSKAALFILYKYMFVLYSVFHGCDIEVFSYVNFPVPYLLASQIL